jgi:hypothetical protein
VVSFTAQPLYPQENSPCYPLERRLGEPQSQFGPGLSLEIKRPECEAGHSPPSSAEVKKMRGVIPPLPNTPSLRGAQLKAEVSKESGTEM